MARCLAERLRAHEQQKARLAEQEAKLKTAERKARTRQLIEIGNLVDKAGLIELDSNTLYGALLSLSTVRATRPSSGNGKRSAGAPSLARRVCVTKARKPPC